MGPHGKHQFSNENALERYEVTNIEKIQPPFREVDLKIDCNFQKTQQTQYRQVARSLVFNCVLRNLEMNESIKEVISYYSKNINNNLLLQILREVTRCLCLKERHLLT